MSKRSVRPFWLLFAALGAGWLVLPVLAYLAGRRVIGPYPGERGLSSYLSSIYVAAAEGRLLALALVFAPMVLVLTWTLYIRLARYLTRLAAGNRPRGPAGS